MVAAGHRFTTLDFLSAVGDTQDDSFSFDSTTFGVDADSGTYVTCGVAFTGPASQAVVLLYNANLDNGTALAATNVAPVVRDGSVVGSGSTILAASLNIALRNVGTEDRRFGAHYFLEGLTTGDAYNVRLEHRVSGNTGTVSFRNVTVVPVH